MSPWFYVIFLKQPFVRRLFHVNLFNIIFSLSNVQYTKYNITVPCETKTYMGVVIRLAI